MVHGRAIAAGDAPGDDPVRLSHDGELVAVAQERDGRLHPIVVLA